VSALSGMPRPSEVSNSQRTALAGANAGAREDRPRRVGSGDHAESVAKRDSIRRLRGRVAMAAAWRVVVARWYVFGRSTPRVKGTRAFQSRAAAEANIVSQGRKTPALAMHCGEAVDRVVALRQRGGRRGAKADWRSACWWVNDSARARHAGHLAGDRRRWPTSIGGELVIDARGRSARPLFAGMSGLFVGVTVALMSKDVRQEGAGPGQAGVVVAKETRGDRRVPGRSESL